MLKNVPLHCIKYQFKHLLGHTVDLVRSGFLSCSCGSGGVGGGGCCEMVVSSRCWVKGLSADSSQVWSKTKLNSKNKPYKI